MNKLCWARPVLAIKDNQRRAERNIARQRLNNVADTGSATRHQHDSDNTQRDASHRRKLRPVPPTLQSIDRDTDPYDRVTNRTKNGGRVADAGFNDQRSDE